MTPTTSTVTPLWKAHLKYRPDKHTGEPTLVACVDNVTLILTHDDDFKGRFARNELTGETELYGKLPAVTGLLPPRRGALDEYVLTYTRIALSAVCRLSVGAEVAAQGIEAAARQRCYNPLLDYLRPLVWDGVQRLPRWLTTYLGVAPSAYAESVGLWWLVSAVARAVQPGCQADHVLILEGPQGAAKSAALRVLAGARYFTDQLPEIGSKDSQQQLLGLWIVELGELDALNRADVTRIKAFITVRQDQYRPSYGRYKVTVPRTCVFAGTTNSTEYLRDETGNRRFWPVKIGRIDLDAMARDRDQIWAEARIAYEDGSRWWPESGMVATLAAEQDERMQGDEWEGIISTWLQEPKTIDASHGEDHGPHGAGEDDMPKDGVTGADVLKGAIGMSAKDWGRAEQVRVGAAMRKLGFALGKEVVERGVRKRRYWRKNDASK